MWYLAVMQRNVLVGMAAKRRELGRDKHLVLADAHHQRTAVPSLRAPLPQQKTNLKNKKTPNAKTHIHTDT